MFRFVISRKLVTATLSAMLLVLSMGAVASDHDDGETDAKSRSLSLTDLYVFKESKEVSGGSATHLVFLMNTNPRSLPRQQYYFSTNARYEFHVSRVGTSKDVAASTDDDITLRFEFGAPNSSNEQAMTITAIRDGVATAYTTKDGGGSILTTPLGGAASPVNSLVTMNSQVLSVFAGLRRDPFFFDVTAFFQFRLAAAVATPAVPGGFSGFPVYTPDSAAGPVDFTTGYNVNTIAVRVPIAWLQSSAETVFDTWTSISIPQ